MNPGKETYVLDSYALLAYLGDEPGKKRIQDVLTQAKSGECSLLLCMINFGEVLYLTERRRGLPVAQRVQAIVESLPIEILPATRDLVLDAAHIKAGYALSYADAFVVAVALRKGATILTGDPEFRTIENLTEIEWLD